MLTLRKDGFSLHLVLSILTILFVAVLVGLFTKQILVEANEKKQFYAARDEVNRIGDELVKRTKPDEHKAVQYCYYLSAKFSKGTRICSADYLLLFKSANTTLGLKEYRDNLSLFGKNAIYETHKPYDANYQLATINFNDYIHSSDCISSYLYNKKDDYPQISKLQRGMPFNPDRGDAVILISCSKEAKAEYFPVVK